MTTEEIKTLSEPKHLGLIVLEVINERKAKCVEMGFKPEFVILGTWAAKRLFSYMELITGYKSHKGVTEVLGLTIVVNPRYECRLQCTVTPSAMETAYEYRK